MSFFRWDKPCDRRVDKRYDSLFGFYKALT